ncbi:MAG: hypothetical protein KC457_00960 [Myxococcales bacterium]|nr:hypothetical protein [Myxococcales bacterium]
MTLEQHLLAIAEAIEPGQVVELVGEGGRVSVTFSRVVETKRGTARRHRASAFVAYGEQRATKGLEPGEVRANYLIRLRSARRAW